MSGLEDASEVYDEAVLKNVSLTGVSLEDLRTMGYPYSTTKAVNSMGDDRQVHTQSGELKDSIKGTRPSEESGRKFTVYFSSSVPYAAFLIFGTDKMRPRRFHEKAFEDVKGKIWQPLKERLSGIQHRIQAKP